MQNFLRVTYSMPSKLNLRLVDASQALEGSDQSQVKISQGFSVEKRLGILTSDWSEPFRSHAVPGLHQPIRGQVFLPPPPAE